MIKKFLVFAMASSCLIITGCIKDTYDMTKLSEDIYISPTFAIAGPKGEVYFSDLAKESDTVVYDQDNFVRIVFRQDSVIDLNLKDYYDFEDMVGFSQSYELGVLSIASFQSTLGLTLGQITQSMTATLRNQITALDDGSPHLFPSFPSVNLGEKEISPFPEFDYAVFHSGYLDLSVTNNLTTPLSGLTVSLFNYSGHTSIGTVSIPAVQPGQTQISSIDLTDKTMTSSLLAGIVLGGSPGTTSPVIISLNNSSISLTVRGRDLKIKSGRVVLPVQELATVNEKDTITFDPGSGIEISEMSINTADISYTLNSDIPLSASVTVTLPTVLKNSVPLTHTINTEKGNVFTGDIDFSSTLTDMSSDPARPYNRIPLEYSVSVGSGGDLVTYNSTDQITIELSLPDPDIDYVKGYFGQESESIEPDTLDLDIEDILENISGEFLISSPSIRLDYSNSFVIPMKIDFQATGIRGSESVHLGLDPVSIAIPGYPVSRDVTSGIVIDKNNSQLPELISMPPGKVVFSGSAAMNPDGNSGLRDNYVFGNSRFIASAEVEIPLEFRMNNFQFADTLDNFLQSEEEDSPVKPENFKLFMFNLTASNYFPLGVAVKMGLYDEDSDRILETIEASSLLEAAPVDANGRSTGPKESTTDLEIDQDFFDAIKSAEKIVMWFTLNTSSSGAVDVKFYSDYKIVFKTSLVIKPEIFLN